MRGRLTAAEREEIARAGHERYKAGESWETIARDLDLHPGSLRRIVAQLAPVEYRRWGQRAVADPAEIARRRGEGESIQSIAESLKCSRTAVRTALESVSGPSATRYPRLSTRRDPTSDEVQELRRLYEACPEAPRNRPGHRETRAEEGAELAEACAALVAEGVPMQTLSLAMGRGATWVHWLLGQHDLRPVQRQSRSTRTRVPLGAGRTTRPADPS
ncbi:hypothetical protein [Brachybacterium sp. sponge]|uniref:hypothetical protein n=1 Tax=Brachybacterium sp. sponge TaxID=1775432 RepID=UPI0007A38CC1|nr:hypothetical protein [Brachybacterium sp. sponge]